MEIAPIQTNNAGDLIQPSRLEFVSPAGDPIFSILSPIQKPDFEDIFGNSLDAKAKTV